MRTVDPPSEDDGISVTESRSARKRYMLEIQKLGECLLSLSGDRIRTLQFPDALKEALLFCQSVRSRSASRRQKQLIGKLIRSCTPIELALLRKIVLSLKPH